MDVSYLGLSRKQVLCHLSINNDNVFGILHMYGGIVGE